MATLKEIQNCQLEMLKVVADICEKHNIRYYLAAGTFLGAVRHQGFIPWDDDIDIYVFNSDLKKLKKICQKELPEKYFWQDYKTDKGTPYIMPKIRNTKTYMPETDNAKTNQGIWLDIFPLMLRASDEKKFRKQVYYISKYQYNLANQMKIFGSHFNSFPKMIYCILRELFVFRPLTQIYYHKALRLGDKKSRLCFALDVSFFGKCDEQMIKITNRESYKTDMFKSMQKYSFEKYSFYGVEDYNQYLSAKFGENYMTPKRYTHFDDYSNVKIND